MFKAGSFDTSGLEGVGSVWGPVLKQSTLEDLLYGQCDENAAGGFFP